MIVLSKAVDIERDHLIHRKRSPFPYEGKALTPGKMDMTANVGRGGNASLAAILEHPLQLCYLVSGLRSLVELGARYLKACPIMLSGLWSLVELDARYLKACPIMLSGLWSLVSSPHSPECTIIFP